MIITFVMIFLKVAPVYAAEINGIAAQSYVLMDAATGQTILAQEEHLRLPPASMTKLMTLILATEALDKGKVQAADSVVASAKAARTEGTAINLQPAEKMSYERMLIAIALASANDASIAVAEHLAGSEKQFALHMNQKAKELGLKDSQFKNATGLPAPGHYSSAYDMAVMARYALLQTRVTQYTSLKEYNLRGGSSKLFNSNKLLWWYEGANGLKTGWTSDAKHCLTASAQRGNFQLIAVVMGCPGGRSHLYDAMKLLNYGFERYECKVLIPKGAVCGTVKVKKGKTDHVQVKTQDAVGSIVLKGQQDKLKSKSQLNSNISAPVEQGQVLGQMLVYNDRVVVKKVNLVAARNVPAAQTSAFFSASYLWLLLLFLSAAGLYIRHRSRNKN
jgi:D-alanyl-D-alanine carboxypeptidase (penicillin-binding protein 5/6)